MRKGVYINRETNRNKSRFIRNGACASSIWPRVYDRAAQPEISRKSCRKVLSAPVGDSRPMRLLPPHDAKQRLRKPPDQPEQPANDKERQLPFILHAPGLRPGCRGVVLAVHLARTSWARGSCVSNGGSSFRRRGVPVQPVCSVRRLLGMPTTLVDLANGWIQPVPQPVSEEVAGHNHQED